MMIDAPSYESDATGKKEKERGRPAIEQKLTPETAKAIMRNASLGLNIEP